MTGWRKDARALAALEVEHQKLINNKVWSSEVHEWSDVASAYRARGETVHIGRVFAIVVLKGSELAVPQQVVKARLVFSGNNVSTNYWSEEAVFADQGSSPAAMCAYRLCLANGHKPGCLTEQADAEAAYVQCDLKGTHTFVVLPPELQTEAERKMRNPVRRLHKSLYGHPDSGSFWEEHCAERLLSVGFTPIDEWSSCFAHESLGLFLVLYVDDFLLSGPKANLEKAWSLIRGVVKLGAQGPLSQFLGCGHIVKPAPLVNDPERVEISYDMRKYLEQAIASYRSLASFEGAFTKVDTPYLVEPEDLEQLPEGKHAHVAQSVLAKLLYCGRLARPDLVLAINLLSRQLTKWRTFHDKGLLRLFCYCDSSKDKMLSGTVGKNSFEQVLYCDADHAGCKETARSTSGMWYELADKEGTCSFPLEWCSKRQSAVAHSTTEAELISLAKGLRETALPLTILLEAVVGSTVLLHVREDNEATIAVVKKGRSVVLRHISKTHRISLRWVAEVMRDPDRRITYVATALQKADGFTKCLERLPFIAMLSILNIK
jgi:hypothetical protein